MSHKTPEYRNPNVKILSSSEDDEDTEKLGESVFSASIISMVTDMVSVNFQAFSKEMLHLSVRILGPGIMSKAVLVK